MPRSQDSQVDYQINAAYIEKLHKLAKKKPKYVYTKIWPQIKDDLCSYIMNETFPHRSQLLGITVIESILMCDLIPLEERRIFFIKKVKTCLMNLLQYDLHGILKQVLHILYSVSFPVEKLLSKADMKRIVNLVFCKNTSTGLEAAKALLIIKFDGNQPLLADLMNIYVEAKNDSPIEFVNVFFESFENIKWPDWCFMINHLLEATETTEKFYLKYLEILTAFIRKTCLGGNECLPSLRTSPSSIQGKNRTEYTAVFLKDIVKILKDSQKFSKNGRIMHFVIDLISNFVLSLIPTNYLNDILEELEVIWNRTNCETTITTVSKIVKHWELYSKNNEEIMSLLTSKMKKLHHNTFTQIISQINLSDNLIISNFEEFKLHTVGLYFAVDTLYSDIWDICLEKLKMFIDNGREKEVKIILTYMFKFMEKNLKTAFADLKNRNTFIDGSQILTIKKSMQKFLPTMKNIIRSEQIHKTCIGEPCSELAKICLHYFTSNWAKSNNAQYRKLLPDGLIYEKVNFQPLIEEYLEK